MKYFLLLIVCFFSLNSCVKTNSVYSKFQRNFENNRWMSNDLRVFEFNIDDENVLYNIEFQFGHIYDYELSKVPVEITILGPDEKVEIINLNLRIKDKSDKDIGQCTGDICDVHQVFKYNVPLKKGSYIVKVRNKSELPYLPNVLGIGLCVEISK